MNRASHRYLSLDVFRGITIAGMMLVNSPGNSTAYAPLEHAEWNGWTPADLVFPFFIFILGVSLVFSFSKRRASQQTSVDLHLQILKRTALIFALGIFLNGFPYYHWEPLRILGVLQRIALCYLFTALLYLHCNLRTLVGMTIGLLVGYWAIMTKIPIPMHGAGDLTKEGNLAAYVDKLILHNHTYRPEYDPEGLLSTLPTIATALIGVFTGLWLSLKEKTNQQKAWGLLRAGVIGIVMGQIWDRWFPINKALWTSSYALFTTGCGLILLALCYWLIEVKEWRRWTYFFEVFGMNAIIAYVISILLLKIQNRIPVLNPDGTMGNLRLFITRHIFESWTSGMNASLLYAVSYTLLWFGILSVMYRKNFFIKI